MSNRNRSASSMDAGRKELIRNIIIAVALILLIAAIIIVFVRENDNGSNYTDVNKNNSQLNETNSGDDSENGASEGNEIDVDNLPKVPVEPAP